MKTFFYWMMTDKNTENSSKHTVGFNNFDNDDNDDGGNDSGKFVDNLFFGAVNFCRIDNFSTFFSSLFCRWRRFFLRNWGKIIFDDEEEKRAPDLFQVRSCSDGGKGNLDWRGKYAHSLSLSLSLSPSLSFSHWKDKMSGWRRFWKLRSPLLSLSLSSLASSLSLSLPFNHTLTHSLVFCVSSFFSSSFSGLRCYLIFALPCVFL